MLLVFVHVAAAGGFTQEIGEGGLEFVGIWVGSILDACSAALMALSTVPSPLDVSPHVAHVDRAATIAPCCAAWTMVE